MKIGIISDVHSNIQALNVVMAKFDEEKVDKIICCGDIIGIGINPEETVQALIKKKDMLIAVLGNHEQYLLNGLPEHIHNDKRKMSKEEIENHKWNHGKLSEKAKAFLNEFKFSQNIEIEGKRFYIIHYPMKADGTFKKHIKNPSIEENKKMFEGIDADVFLYGHTHTYSVNCEDNKWYINPGSLGCPMYNDIAKAGILEINNGKIDFKAIDVKYNVTEIVEEMNKLKFPFYREILKIFYGK
ncbi:MAG: metallophosphoesterase family protein [Clostridia bacterium]|nr:metallophosphoesterase family protein [Clostridia bacterium]